MNTEQFYTEVGKRIRQYRDERGLTQEALSRLVALKRTSITNIEQGKQKVLLDTFWDMARALEVEPSDLLPKVSNPSTQQPQDSVLPEDLSQAEKQWILSVMMDPTIKRE